MANHRAAGAARPEEIKGSSSAVFQGTSGHQRCEGAVAAGILLGRGLVQEVSREVLVVGGERLHGQRYPAAGSAAERGELMAGFSAAFGLATAFAVVAALAGMLTPRK